MSNITTATSGLKHHPGFAVYRIAETVVQPPALGIGNLSFVRRVSLTLQRACFPHDFMLYRCLRRFLKKKWKKIRFLIVLKTRSFSLSLSLSFSWYPNFALRKLTLRCAS